MIKKYAVTGVYRMYEVAAANATLAQANMIVQALAQQYGVKFHRGAPDKLLLKVPHDFQKEFKAQKIKHVRTEECLLASAVEYRIFAEFSSKVAAKELADMWERRNPKGLVSLELTEIRLNKPPYSAL